MKRITIKDIARHMNLSVSTVSRALADDKNIRKETRLRIFEVAESLGYRRNPLAVSLRTGRSGTIGIIAREMVTPCASALLEGIYPVMHKNGINVIMANSDNDHDRELGNLQMLEDSMVDGIIVDACGCDSNINCFRRLHKKGVPMVFVFHAPRGIDADVVLTDDYEKVGELVTELIRRGYRRIINIKGTPRSLYNVDIHRAFSDAHIAAGIPCRSAMTIEADPDFDAGRRVVDAIIDSEMEFDAIFAYNELVGIGVLHRLRERDIDVPGKVAVAAFGGTSLSTFVFPTLTALERPLYEVGRIAAELLLERIRGDRRLEDYAVHTVSSEIKLRSSV